MEYVIIVLVTAVIFGFVCRRLHLPALIGEIGAGILLGPTVFTHIATFPQILTWLTQIQERAAVFHPILKIVSIILLFYYGTIVRLNHLPTRRNILQMVGWSLFIPAIFGVAIGLIQIFPTPANRLVTGLILAVLLAVSALPVIARIFLDLGIHQSRFGTTIIAVASINDLVCWIALSLILGYFGPTVRPLNFVRLVIIYSLLFLVFAFLKQALIWLRKRKVHQRLNDLGSVVGISIIVIAGGLLAQQVGIDWAVMAFFVGVMFGSLGQLSSFSTTWLRRIALWICSPIYFASVGLRTDYFQNFNLRIVVIIIVVAYLSKIISGWLGARALGWPVKLRWAAGISLSARGAMDIIMATIVLASGFISATIFEAFVIMAVVTSLTTYSIRPLVRTLPV